MTLSLKEMAQLLAGEVVKDSVLCLGPGHSAADRSLSVTPNKDTDCGFVLHSFAGDDPIACKDYVRQKLNLPPFEPKATRMSRSGGSGKPYSPTVATFTYRNADGSPYLRVQRTANKDFYQSHWNGEIWKNGAPKGPKIPYQLPELIAAPITKPIYITEGEGKADMLVKLGFTATSASGGAGKWTADLNKWFENRVVIVLADNDRSGRNHVQLVARNLDPVAKSVRVVALPGLPPKGDIKQWLVHDPSGSRLVKECERTPPWEPNTEQPSAESDDDESIRALAELREFAYEKCRVEEAEKLGITVKALDKIVRQRRAQSQQDQATLPHWKVEPWPSDVLVGDLLDDIKAVFEKYIVLPLGAGDALALWVLHAWTMDAGDISPFIVLVSPTKRCGKTSVLIILTYLTPRSELASNISPSALFRYVEEIRPTLLIDEGDSFMKDNEELRGILNSGHTKAAAYVIRNVEVNGEFKPRRFSTWAPKAIATIRTLADTLEDRAIVLNLQRKPKAAKVVRLRKRDSDEFAILRRKAARWADDNIAKLTDPDPDIPDALNDRAADNWRPLLQIADLAGGVWPRQARSAACILSGEGHESTSINIELLADIRTLWSSLESTPSAHGASGDTVSR